MDHRPCSGKNGPYNERDLKVLIHVENNEIAGDDELIHLNWNIFENAYRLPGEAIAS